jgi:hypothetical protein
MEASGVLKLDRVTDDDFWRFVVLGRTEGVSYISPKSSSSATGTKSSGEVLLRFRVDGTDCSVGCSTSPSSSSSITGIEEDLCFLEVDSCETSTGDLAEEWLERDGLVFGAGVGVLVFGAGGILVAVAGVFFLVEAGRTALAGVPPPKLKPKDTSPRSCALVQLVHAPIYRLLCVPSTSLAHQTALLPFCMEILALS